MFKYSFTYSNHFSNGINYNALQEDVDESGLDCDGFHFKKSSDSITFIFPNETIFVQAISDSLTALMDEHTDSPYYIRLAKKDKKQELNDYRDSLLLAGLPYNAAPLTSELLYQADREKRTDLGTVIANGKDVEEINGAGSFNYEWWSVDNIEHTFTLLELKLLRLSLSVPVGNIYKNCRYHKNQVMLLSDAELINGYDYSGDWTNEAPT